MKINSQAAPKARTLLLVGGGHSHALFLRMLGMSSIEGLSVILVSDVSHTAYSGMLPGLIAGIYSWDKAHIDLPRLCMFSGSTFVKGKAIKLNLENKLLELEGGRKIAFDVVSIDIGSTPSQSTITGADKFSIPVKPIPAFLKSWQLLLKQCQKLQSLRIVIVGGGAGGVELSMAMQKHLEKKGFSVQVQIVHRESTLLNEYNGNSSRIISRYLQKRKIDFALNEEVVRIEESRVLCKSGRSYENDATFLVTSASAPKWPGESGLAVNKAGFISIKNTLQSTSHSFVFATGDIASLTEREIPKAGVFPVRQAKPLFCNIKRFLENKKLREYKPQRKYLSLISTSNFSALASRGSIAKMSPLLWLLKDHIDKKFMRKFENLPAPKITPVKVDPHGSNLQKSVQDLKKRAFMRCAGCGAKTSQSILKSTLYRIEEEVQSGSLPSNVLVDLDKLDDAAVFSIPSSQILVQSIDYVSALVDDPFVFAQIAVEHAFNDIFAMGARPRSAQLLVTLPFASERINRETLYQLLTGAMKSLADHGAELIGGHTTEGLTLGLGVMANGYTHARNLLDKTNLKEGNILILNKGLGTGTLFAAHMRLQAAGRHIEKAIQSMLLSNAEALDIILSCDVTCCTDVTGFGLAGHLLEMLERNSLGANIQLDNLPVLAGAIETLERGLKSSLSPENYKNSARILMDANHLKHKKYPLLFDPQTSGGLLIAAPENRAPECLERLKAAGYLESKIIGTVSKRPSSDKAIRLV